MPQRLCCEKTFAAEPKSVIRPNLEQYIDHQKVRVGKQRCKPGDIPTHDYFSLISLSAPPRGVDPVCGAYNDHGIDASRETTSSYLQVNCVRFGSLHTYLHQRAVN